ncbi:hypothetical protein GAN17_21305 [Mycobacterium kubicae]|nr:hypothetical protein GAN17_21305 [Mycobacterium kubicae]
MSPDVRPNAAETKPLPVSPDDDSGTAADIRALAEEAEAEAAEAEALAAAARARARALALRRKADRAEAAEKDLAAEPDLGVEKGPAAEKSAATAEIQTTQEASAASGIATPDLERAEGAAETADVEITEVPSETATETDLDTDAESDQDSGDHSDAGDDTAQAAQEPGPQVRRLAGRRRRPNWSTVLTGIAALIIIAAVSGSVYMIKHHEDAVRRRQLVAEFSAAARQGVVTLTSLNFQNAKNDIQRIVDNSTGSFRDDLLKTADEFGKVVEESKVVEQGTVQLAAVDLDTLTRDSAVVYVASTSEVTNSAGAKQDPRNYRLIVTMTRDGGQLKMSKVEFVP